jgi:hypothetical protein
MALPDTIPQSVIDFVVALLLPLILPACTDPATARALALRMLAAHNPEDERDLQLAAEAVAFSIRTMAAFAEAADPGTPPERRDAASRRASSLSRSGLQVQRCLGALQRERRAARRAPPPFTFGPMHEDPSAWTSMMAPPVPEAEPSTCPLAEIAATDPEPAQSTSDPVDVPQAEMKLHSAEKLLALMQAYHKGAPPPHTKAAQDIQAQRRVVEAARMALTQARRRDATGLPAA